MTDQTIFYIGIGVILILILAFIFTGRELKQLREKEDPYYQKEEDNSVEFEERAG